MEGLLNDRSPPLRSIPVELLREWTLVATHRKNLALVGSTLSAAAASGYTLEALLGDGMALAMGSTILGMFRGAVREANDPQPKPSASAVESSASGGAALTSSTAPTPFITQSQCWNDVLPLGSEPLPSELLVTAETHEMAPTMTIIKRVSNGVVTFFVCRGYLANLLTLEETKHQLNRSGFRKPPYIHPDDGGTLGRVVHKDLWESLAPHEYDGTEARAAEGASTVKSCSFPVVPGGGVRVWMRSSVSYVRTRAATQLVVMSGDHGQTSYTTIRFQVSGEQDAAAVPMLGNSSVVPPFGHSIAPLGGGGSTFPSVGGDLFGGGGGGGAAVVPAVVPDGDASPAPPDIDVDGNAIAAVEGGDGGHEGDSAAVEELADKGLLDLPFSPSDDVDDFWNSVDLLVADDFPSSTDDFF